MDFIINYEFGSFTYFLIQLNKDELEKTFQLFLVNIFINVKLQCINYGTCMRS